MALSTHLALVAPLSGKGVHAQALHAVVVELALVDVAVGKVVDAVADLQPPVAIRALEQVSVV